MKTTISYNGREIVLTHTQKAVLCKVINLPVDAEEDIISAALGYENEALIYDYDAPTGDIVTLSFYHGGEYWSFDEKGGIGFDMG